MVVSAPISYKVVAVPVEFVCVDKYISCCHVVCVCVFLLIVLCASM